jgi:hypothetical protein
MALVMALTLIALIGLAVAGGLAHTVASQRAAVLSQNAATLDAAADRALGTVLSDAPLYGLASIRLGESRSFELQMAEQSEISATVAVTRLAGDVLWMVAAVASRADTSAERRVNLVARFPSIGVPPPAALMTRGNLVLHDGVRFTADTARESDCAAGAGAAAIVAPGATVSVPSGLRVDTATFARDSAAYYLTQRQLAMLSRAPGVVHATGDTTISGGTLNGILLVDGALTVHGTFAASGLIIARGVIDASGATLTVRGVLLSFAAPSNVSTILTAASVEYSPCVVMNVMRVALSPRVVRSRSWAEFF